MLFEPPVLAEHVAVVPCVNDERIRRLTGALQRVEDPPHVFVEKFDGCIIGGGDSLFLGGFEIAEDRRNLRVVFRPDGGNREFIGLVPAAILDWKMKRRMRLVKTDHQEERPLFLRFPLSSRRRPLAQEPGRLVSEICTRHVTIDGGERFNAAVEPGPGRVAERFPRRLGLDSSGERLLSLRLQPFLVVREIDARLKTVFQIRIEMHLADGGRVIAGVA